MTMSYSGDETDIQTSFRARLQAGRGIPGPPTSQPVTYTTFATTRTLHPLVGGAKPTLGTTMKHDPSHSTHYQQRSTDIDGRSAIVGPSLSSPTSFSTPSTSSSSSYYPSYTRSSLASAAFTPIDSSTTVPVRIPPSTTTTTSSTSTLPSSSSLSKSNHTTSTPTRSLPPANESSISINPPINTFMSMNMSVLDDYSDLPLSRLRSIPLQLKEEIHTITSTAQETAVKNVSVFVEANRCVEVAKSEVGYLYLYL